jgi:inhibitor of KinA sporulation pathway (predicted exonuclease)
MKTSSKILIASVLVVAVGGTALAFGGRHHFSNMTPEEKADMISYYASRKLDLNTEQEIKLETLTQRLAEIAQQLREERGARQQWLDDMISEGPLDQAALLQKISSKTDTVNQHAPEVVGLIADFVDSLDMDQKKGLKEMIAHRGRHHHGGRWGHRFGDRDWSEDRQYQ